jgi:hypothetical protein
MTWHSLPALLAAGPRSGERALCLLADRVAGEGTRAYFAANRPFSQQ